MLLMLVAEGRWKTAVNLVNPLGTKGQLAHAFATLLHEMWHGDLPYRSPYQFRVRNPLLVTQSTNAECRKRSAGSRRSLPIRTNTTRKSF